MAECSSSLGPSLESNQVQLGWQVLARARLTDIVGGYYINWVKTQREPKASVYSTEAKLLIKEVIVDTLPDELG